MHAYSPFPRSQAYRLLQNSLVDMEGDAALSHAKIIRVGWVNARENDGCEEHDETAWLYAGSHNLSSAAWEKNYECGVVIPLKRGSQAVLNIVEVDLHLQGQKYPVEQIWRN